VYNAPLFSVRGLPAPSGALHGGPGWLGFGTTSTQVFSGAYTMDGLISTAAAQAQGATGQSNALLQFLPLVLIFVVFYFMLIRPQTKRAKEHRAMVAALEVGAEVVTNGGILGKVTEVSDQFLTIEIADGVNVKVQRHTVTQVLPKGTLKSA
jgi:preprotein translocase subunit YajC